MQITSKGKNGTGKSNKAYIQRKRVASNGVINEKKITRTVWNGGME